MPQTPLLGLIYGEEWQNPHYTSKEARMNQLDSFIYSALEGSNLVLHGGGEVTLDDGADELTWTEDFELMNMLTGGVVTIEADTLTGFEDGKIAYVTVTRPISGSATGTLEVTDTIGNDYNKVFIALRVGTELFMFGRAVGPSVVTVDQITYVVGSGDGGKRTVCLVDRTATGPCTIIIPSVEIAIAGREVVIKDSGQNSSSNNITVATGGSETIDGSSTAVISTDGQSLTVISDGSNLHIINRSGP